MDKLSIFKNVKITSILSKKGDFELSKSFNSMTIIVIGIIVFLIGGIQPARYDKAKENGYEVDATIVEVKTEIESGTDGGPDSISYTVYADYEIDEKEYKHIKVGKYYDTDEYYVGKVIKVVVNPDSGKPMGEGGILCVIGLLITVGGIIIKVKTKKNG